MALNPAWVRMDRLTAGRESATVALPNTPKGDRSTHDPTDPLYAIYGPDPRATASLELGKKLVSEIVSRLAQRVDKLLAETEKGKR